MDIETQEELNWTWEDVLEKVRLSLSEAPRKSKYDAREVTFYLQTPSKEKPDDLQEYESQAVFSFIAGGFYPVSDLETVLLEFLSRASTGWEIYEFARFRTEDKNGHCNPAKFLEVAATHDSAYNDSDPSKKGRMETAALYMDYYKQALHLFGSYEALDAALEAANKAYPGGF